MIMISANHQARLKELISSAVRSRASDLHLSVGTAPVIRVSQRLQTLTEDIIITTEFVQEAAVYLAGLDERKIERGVELYFSVTLEAGIRIKVTIFYQKGLPAVTIKFIPGQIKNLDQLGLPQAVKKISTLKHGLVVVAGPYGSGKSATIAALIQDINTKRREYIITLERPIEYIFTSQSSVIEQREIGRDTKTLEQALKYLKHEDVDVVIINELNTPESIMLALEIASVRALVIVSVDSDSVVNTINKLISNFSSEKQDLVRRLLSESLVSVMVQRLLPRLGGGVVPAVELLFSTPPVKELLKKGKIENLNNIITISAKDGMINLNRSLRELAAKKIISQSDALNEAVNRESFSRSLIRP